MDSGVIGYGVNDRTMGEFSKFVLRVELRKPGRLSVPRPTGTLRDAGDWRGRVEERCTTARYRLHHCDRAQHAGRDPRRRRPALGAATRMRSTADRRHIGVAHAKLRPGRRTEGWRRTSIGGRQTIGKVSSNSRDERGGHASKIRDLVERLAPKLPASLSGAPIVRHAAA